ncbi:hypothetical protein ACHAXR_004995 [Thalassiosira sp. AJA248-18]
MKDFISPLATLLVAASFSGAEAKDSSKERRLSAARDFLTELSTSLENPKSSLGDDDWTKQLSCTADMNSPQPTLIDQNTCSSTNDSNGQACLWCDATATLGSGLCVSPDQKAMLGQYWDQLCGTSTTPAVDPPAPPPAPVTPNPTPPPTNPAPAPGPGPDDVPDALKCSMDASSNIITDEATCIAQADSTDTSGGNCVWCQVPILGGSCITNSMKTSVSFLCSNNEEEEMAKNNLRGGEKDDAWKQLDPSCLGDGNGLGGDKDEGCATRVDSDGNKCIWCDAGGVFGICATPSQKDYLGGYMDCAAPTAPFVAVE